MNPADNSPPTAAHRTTPPWWLVVLAVLAVALLVAGVWAKYHQHTTATSTAATTLTPAEYDARITHPNSVFDITVDDGKLVKGPSKITVKQGASVQVRIHPIGEETNLRLDGYDIIAESAPSDDIPGSFSFVADKAGSFKFYSVSDDDSDSSSTPAQTLLGEIIVQ